MGDVDDLDNERRETNHLTGLSLLSGSRDNLCLLHLCLHSDILSEDPPEHEGARHSQRDRGLLRQRDCLDAGQTRHQRSRCFLLPGVSL